MARSCCASGRCCGSNIKEKEQHGAATDQHAVSSAEHNSTDLPFTSSSSATITTADSDTWIVSAACDTKSSVRQVQHVSVHLSSETNTTPFDLISTHTPNRFCHSSSGTNRSSETSSRPAMVAHTLRRTRKPGLRDGSGGDGRPSGGDHRSRRSGTC